MGADPRERKLRLATAPSCFLADTCCSIACGFRARRLEDVDSGFGITVLNASAQAREEYYERRIDAPLAGAWQLLAETLRRTGKAAPRDAVLGYIRAGARPHGGSKSLPKEYDAERFLNHMIRRGVLQRATGHMLACPIPPFRDYIERIARNTQPET